MSLSSSIDYLSFQRRVQCALKDVERVLELERKPRLADEVDHTYGEKYGLVNQTSNSAIIAFMNCFEKLGLDASVLKSIDKTKPATLRFDSSTSYKFVKEMKVDVPANRSYEETEKIIATETESDTSKTTSKSRVMTAINHVTELHWELEVIWCISIYSGTSLDEETVLNTRKCATQLITQGKEVFGTSKLPPSELSLTWLLQQIDTEKMCSQFKIDVEDDATTTPCRNVAIEKATDFAKQLTQWCDSIRLYFAHYLQQNILLRHNPALPQSRPFTCKNLLQLKDQHSIFNPILPLMEERERSTTDTDTVSAIANNAVLNMSCSNNNDDDSKPLLSFGDVSKLLNEHGRTLNKAVVEVENIWPRYESGNVLSSCEAVLYLLSAHLGQVSMQYIQLLSYVESMMENQLIAAVGKRVTPKDLDKFVKYHNARLLHVVPQPFSHAIRQPEHFPVGLLSIESIDGDNECIHSHSREVNPATSLKIPLNAATVLELTGQQYLHGYVSHRFGSTHKRHQLLARARQFSAFILVIGTMGDGLTLDPKDAIIVQNKDELMIPLILEELPTAKEFKDAIQSLSPEQQRFARAYRKMQLASSVLGICVIQITPQLEALLGLPKDSLDKEMKLTQDLMELFIEYQVPSDMLSYSGLSENVAVADKIANVRDNVKRVLDVVNEEKDKQTKSEQAKTEMAVDLAVGQALGQAVDESTGFWASPSDSNSGSACQMSHSSFGGVDQFYSGLAKPPAHSSFSFRSPAPAHHLQPAMEVDFAAAQIEMPPHRHFQYLQPAMPMMQMQQQIPPPPQPTPPSSYKKPYNALRRERNREYAKSSRIRKKSLLESLQAKVNKLEEERALLKQGIQDGSLAVNSSTADQSNNAKRNSDGNGLKRVSNEAFSSQEKRSKTSAHGKQSKASANDGVDFTLIPQTLDAEVEKKGQGNMLRSTTIKTGDGWVRNRQKNLLTTPTKQNLSADDIKMERNKAFDLLDSLSRSGSLPIAYSELHVVVAVTHCFDKGVMGTVICDNVNPIEKLECSTLLLASVVHGVPARKLIENTSDLQRLEGTFPLLLQASVANEERGENEAQG